MASRPSALALDMLVLYPEEAALKKVSVSDAPASDVTGVNPFGFTGPGCVLLYCCDNRDGAGFETGFEITLPWPEEVAG